MDVDVQRDIELYIREMSMQKFPIYPITHFALSHISHSLHKRVSSPIPCLFISP